MILEMRESVSVQCLNGRIHTDRLNAVLASAVETVSGINASRRTKFYWLKVSLDVMKYLTDASFDASSWLKSGNLIKLIQFPAIKFSNPGKIR